MRANDARKWLHAGLDLLPLILIPVFMIYSHRHTIDSGSIEVPINRVVDFNQLIQNGNFETTNNWFVTGDTDISLSVNDNICTFTYATTGTNSGLTYAYYPLILNHIYYTRCYVTNHNNASTIIQIGQSYVSNGKEVLPSQTELIDFRWQVTELSGNYKFFEIGDRTGSGLINNFSVTKVNLFDLTQMFGEGNEPTLEKFNAWYSADYYDYTLSHKELLKGYTTVTYDDTDIMSQFTYQLYNSVDKYFNMGNVFGMSNVYDWFNLNIFGGNASISIYIVWNIVLYEFVMDLLFLLYSLFMWFIDVTKRLIEKPLDSIK